MTPDEPTVTTALGPFGMVPAGIIESALSDAAVRLYAYLWRKGGNDGSAYPSLATMADDLGWSREKAKRTVGELRAAALVVVVEERQRENGARSSNRYRVEWSSPLVPAVGFGTPRVMGDPGVMADPGPRVAGDPGPGSLVTPQEVDPLTEIPSRKIPSTPAVPAALVVTPGEGEEIRAAHTSRRLGAADLSPSVRSLADALHDRGVRVAWALTAEEDASVAAQIALIGQAGLMQNALDTAAGLATRPRSARVFLTGWLGLLPPPVRAACPDHGQPAGSCSGCRADALVGDR